MRPAPKRGISQRTSLSGEPVVGFYIYEIGISPEPQATLPALMPLYIQVACQKLYFGKISDKLLKNI
jgi:hypothetical protein